MASVFNDPQERAFAEERGDMYYSHDHLYQKGQEHMAEEKPKTGELAVQAGPVVQRILGHPVEEGHAKQLLDRASLATAQKIKQMGWLQEISGRNYVTYEGWSFLGTTFFGLSPYVESVEEIAEGAWLAWCQVRDAEGNIRSRACAVCSTDEKFWKTQPLFARVSMAQTRSMSKAYRMSLSQVMCMAGFSATPAEEMDHLKDPPKRQRKAAKPHEESDDKTPF